MKSGC